MERTRRPEKIAEYEADLACPPLPPELLHVWRAFGRLSSRRGSNGFGINPIGWSEFDAFLRLTKTRLTPWEVAQVEMLDDLLRAEIARSDKSEPASGNSDKRKT